MARFLQCMPNCHAKGVGNWDPENVEPQIPSQRSRHNEGTVREVRKLPCISFWKLFVSFFLFFDTAKDYSLLPHSNREHIPGVEAQSEYFSARTHTGAPLTNLKQPDPHPSYLNHF